MTSPEEDPVVRWLHELADGDEQAATELWRLFCRRLTTVARQRLGTLPRRTFDEEDIALGAMHSLISGLRDGRYPHVHDRDSAWRLLVAIVYNQVRDRRRRETAVKRGGGKVRGESVFQLQGEQTGRGLDQVVQRGLSPDRNLELIESCALLIQHLEQPELIQVAQYKLDGFSNQEIADRIGACVSTVERRLACIRRKWQRRVQKPLDSSA